MAIRPKLLDDEQFFQSAHAVVRPGNYRKYVNDYPEFLRQDAPQRAPNANTCKMVVATTWQGSQIEGFTPHGDTYFVFTCQDHRHGQGEQHFNKTVQVYTHNAAGQPYRLTMEKGVDDHYIKATALGTALPYLEQAYRIPEHECGSIDDLIAGGTSIEPYPNKR
jgi:hypothetical protein